MTSAETSTPPYDLESAQPRGLRLWAFRLAAAVLVPILFLAGLEVALRLGGVGHGTGFLQPSDAADGTWVTNRRFGYRFFPPKIARAPVAFELREKAADEVVRVFVVGGSAAMGTPDSAFGLARLLDEMLSRALPGREVAVHNAAMAAVNSHVVLPIVRELARRDADLFVVYLGNNEVVGPFGAATVFGPVAPGTATVRASIVAKSTRIGQLADRLLAGDGGVVEWRGMEMFLEQRVAVDDPRLAEVYRSFERNLEDIVAAARGGGAEVVLSTVAVNLRDQAPFASLHRTDLTEGELAEWRSLRDGALASLRSGDYLSALDGLEAAAEIDDGHAELHFLLGHTLLGLDDFDGARRELTAARDLDALRFRADSRVNEIIREVASRLDVPLVDAAELFAAGESLPGRRLFHEHVHLNVLGTHALASAVFRAAWERLPGVDPAGLPAAAGVDALADGLPITAFDVYGMEREIYALTGRPPFTAAFGHGDDRALRRRRLEALRSGLDGAEWRRARGLYQARLRSHPDDLEARRRFATLLGSRGEPGAAVEQWRSLVDRIPGVMAWHDALATQLAAAGRLDEALAEQERLLELWPEHETSIRVNMGSLLESGGRLGAAGRQYELALQADADDPRPRYNLATLAAERGDLDAAVGVYRAILEDHPDFAPAHHNLGVAVEKQDGPRAAAEHYRRAVEAQPDRAQSHVALGLVLEQTGESDEAFASYRRALEASPDDATAYFRLGDLLLAHGRAAEAAVIYQGGLRLEPRNEAARRNLTTAIHAAEAASVAEELATPDQPRE